jgi:hypothetical protein
MISKHFWGTSSDTESHIDHHPGQRMQPSRLRGADAGRRRAHDAATATGPC